MFDVLRVFGSGSAGWKLIGGDLPAGPAVRLPLRGAGLLEGPDRRRGAGDHTRLHHDLRDLFQGTGQKCCEMVLMA